MGLAFEYRRTGFGTLETALEGVVKEAPLVRVPHKVTHPA
jgi:hypothetical protein